MAQLSPRTESFISLLLNVTGRARTADLQGVSPAEAAEILQGYAAAHPEVPLAFDGQSLSYGAGTAAPAPHAVPTAPTQAPPTATDQTAFATPVSSAPTTPAPIPDSFGAVEAPQSFPPAAAPQALDPAFPGSAVPVEGEAFQVPPGDWVQQAPIVHDFGVPDAPAASAAVPTDFSLPEQAFADSDEPLYSASEIVMPETPPVPWFWWVIAVLFSWVGGLIGWLVLRKDNPQGARKVLIVGIVAAVLSVAIGIAAVTFGGTLLIGAANSSVAPTAPAN